MYIAVNRSSLNIFGPKKPSGHLTSFFFWLTYLFFLVLQHVYSGLTIDITNIKTKTTLAKAVTFKRALMANVIDTDASERSERMRKYMKNFPASNWNPKIYQNFYKLAIYLADRHKQLVK